MVVVTVAAVEAHATDHVGHGHHNVTEGFESAVGLHDVSQPLDQVQALFADVFLQGAGVLSTLTLDRRKRAQSALGELAPGPPYTRLVCAERQALPLADEAEAIEVRTSGELVTLLDQGLAYHLTTAQHCHGSRADLNLENWPVALTHGCQTQVRVTSQFQHISKKRERFRAR